MDDPDLDKQPEAEPENPEKMSGPSEAPASVQPSEAVDDEPDTFTPPTPGQVITSEPEQPAQGEPARPETIQPPGAEVPTSPNPPPPGGGKRWLKVLICLVILALIAVGGWFAYNKYYKKSSTVSTTQSKDIPLLKIGTYQAGYGTLYPKMGNNEYSYMTNSQMFEGLVRFENKSKIVPDLASNWTNPDDNTWVFTIAKGVKFHDGHTLTAKDVKYSLDSLIASNSAIAQTFADTIKSVDLVGTDQVKITTAVPDPVLLNKVNYLYVIDANLPKGDEPSQAGTGPYEIKPGTTPTDTNVQMVAFNNYHGGRPTTQALDFGGINNAASLLKAFKAHQYNIIGPVPLSDKNAAGATQFNVTEADTAFIGLNTVQPGPLQNKLVRQAIRYTVNPVALGKADDKAVTPASQLVPPSIPGYNPEITPYKQDIAKAKQLLAQAGYPNGLTLRLSSSASRAWLSEFTNELKQAGITVTADNHTDFNEFIDYFTGGKAQMYDVDYSSDTLDGLDIYTTTLPSANYSNPKVTDLLNQAGTTVDPAKRLKLLQDAATIIDQDVPVVPLYSVSDVWLMDKNYVIRQDMPSSLLSAYFSKVHQP